MAEFLEEVVVELHLLLQVRVRLEMEESVDLELAVEEGQELD
jgi:hypothetical protein